MSGSITTLFFDLDETLVVERATAERVVHETCKLAGQRHGLSAVELAPSVFDEARNLWYRFELHAYCERIAVSSWEGLWCRFEGNARELAVLRRWAPIYRKQTWWNALLVHGVDDEALAEEMAECYPESRRRVHVTFPDTVETLDKLRGHYKLGIVTNGPSDLQREKLAGAKIAHYFDAVSVAGDVGARKPGEAIFKRALELAGSSPRETMIVGDSLEGDIAGANRLGIEAVWLNRNDQRNDTCAMPDHEVRSLAEVPGILRKDEG